MSYGDGTIHRRRDGRLEVRCSINGVRVSRFVSARKVRVNKREAEREAELIRRELQRRRDAALFPSAQTVADYLRSWIQTQHDARRSRIRTRTLDGYTMIVERHIIPALGKLRLDRLSERDIQAWIDRQDAEPRTIDRRRAVLRRALNVAIRQRLIDRNPAANVEVPDAPEFRGRPLSVVEVGRLFRASADDSLSPLWRLAIDTGARQGELLGLGWDDLDLDQGTVTIASQIQRRRGQWVRVPTKASRDVLTISLDRDTVASLKAHQVRQATLRQPDWVYYGLVFSEDGQPLKSWDVLRRFHAALERAGLARRRFHDLRGTSATVMRALGIPEDVRMMRLGHSTVDMARHYGQATVGLDRAASAALGNAIREAM